MLKTENLEKTFGRTRAVDHITLTIPEGEMVGIIGRSGAGKSTLLRLINRLIHPSGGRLEYGTTDIAALKGAELRAWRSRCAMIFQQFNLVNRLNVITNVLVGRIGYRAPVPTLFKFFTREERAMAIRALERLDMACQALQRTDTLSGGQQQRVAIARAMVQEPSVVLADEPIASLDPHNAAKVMEALRDFNRQDGVTVLCNLHQVSTAKTYCDRILGMARGRIVFDGAPADLTMSAIREIYGTDVEDEELRQALDMPAPVREPREEACAISMA